MRPAPHIRDDEGFALALVLGAIALISTVAIGGFFLARQALNDSTRVTFENRAYQAASTGLERELATFSIQKLNAHQYPIARSINGSDTYTVDVITTSDGVYKMVSVGTSSGTTETVSVRFQNFNLWDMNIAGADNSTIGSGAGFNGNGTIIGPVYANGNMDWSGNGSLLSGPVFVRNGVFNKQSSGSNVGVSSSPVDMYIDNAVTGSTSNMYTTLRGSAPALEIPWLTSSDMSYYLQLAKSESTAQTLTGTAAPGVPAMSPYYKYIPTDLTINDVAFGYGPKLSSTAIPAPDQFAYDPIDGSLRVSGIVYIDGKLTIGAKVSRYYGTGVLCARDGIEINGSLVPAAYLDGNPAYRDASDYPKVGTDYCLGLVTPGAVTLTTGNGPWGMVGAIFSNGKFTATSTGAKYRGSIVAGGIDFSQPNGLLVTQPGLSDYLYKDGMPALEGITARGDWERQ